MRLTATIAAVALLAGCSAASDRVYSGSFSAERPISIANRTIEIGQYLISYSLEVLVVPQGPPTDVRCTVVDTTGRIEFFSDLARTVPSGEWVRISAEGTFDLPDLTLGLRCIPEQDARLDLVVRDVQLSAERR